MFFTTIPTSKKMFFFSEGELKKALRDRLTRAGWLGPRNELIGSFWACACNLSWTLLSPARVQPLPHASLKERKNNCCYILLKWQARVVRIEMPLIQAKKTTVREEILSCHWNQCILQGRESKRWRQRVPLLYLRKHAWCKSLCHDNTCLKCSS